MSSTTVRLTRKELYEEIWKISVAGVSKKYGIPYVSAMEKAHADQDLSAWASWARAKADWYDPTIAKEDELLGKREHEKSQESKGPQHKGYRW